MPRILVVDSPYYPDIAEALYFGASTVLENAGMDFERLSVPGALEIPAAIRLAVESGRYDGYVALGCIIRGETTHYDTVCEESARGLTWLAIEYMAPIGNGILTVENHEQALVRAQIAGQDKGGGAAEACLALLRIKQEFGIEKGHKHG